MRAAFGDFLSYFKRHFRSLVPPRRPSATCGAPSSNRPLTRVQKEIETARDSTQSQIASALANRFGALGDLPSAPEFSANHLTVPLISGSTQATMCAITADNNADNSDDDSMSIKSEDTSECESDCENHSDESDSHHHETEIKVETIEEDTNEIAATVGTPNVNSNNNDNASVKTENESECDSSDSESSDDEEELTAGRGIKEEHQEENETQSIDSTNTIDSNFESTDLSPLVKSKQGSNRPQSDTVIIDEENANEDSVEEGDGGPTIIVVYYEEFEPQSIGNPNDQSKGAGCWSNDESTNIAGPDGDFVETVDSNENDNHQLSEAMMVEANGEQGQAGPSIVSNPTSTLTRRSTRASTTKKINYSKAIENSMTEQKGTLTGTHKHKRSGKANAPKRSRIGPASIAAQLQPQMTDDSEDEEEDDTESEAISFRIIVRRLNCRVPGCKKVFSGKVQLNSHLLTKHAIEKYACKVNDCTESYATMGELTAHRNSAHDNLDNDWPCGQCEVTCNTYQNLYTHTWNYHEYGQFACSADKCNYTEKTRIKVKNHQAKHRPAKYRCTYPGCSSSFKLKSNLTTHFRVHSKEKPFLCPQCPKAFAQKNSLSDHERVHSGLKPFSCTWPHCDFSASQRSHVITHIRSVHFGLPPSKTEQRERGIIDNRDARVFVKTNTNTGI